MLSELRQRIEDRSAQVGVIGLGYVGLPVVRAFWEAGFRVIGFDTDPVKIDALLSGKSYIGHFAATAVQEMIQSGRFLPTSDFSKLGETDCVLVCVPTPLNRSRGPDLIHVRTTMKAIAANMRPQTLVVLESTTYPGTTQEVALPILLESGQELARDFALAFAPEREDPGRGMDARNLPRVVGGIDQISKDLACALYSTAFHKIHPVSDAQTAEAVKLTENIFRAVNIALVNELKLIYTAMGIDVWEVIEAAKTKPFGYMAFYPGPGLGGHCIPIDPFYLSWRARAFEIDARLVELAGEINRAMPQLVIRRLSEALSQRFGRAMNGARILVLGVAYKKNVDDVRESPSLKLIHSLRNLGALVDYHDPYCPEIQTGRDYASISGMRSTDIPETKLSSYDAALIVTDHDQVDYAAVVRACPLVIDTRNALRDVVEGREKIVRA